jgi:hypothetical protein
MSDKPNFDPAKTYSWSPNDDFVIKGDMFAMMLNLVRGTISTPEAQKILSASVLANRLDEVMAKAVENGVAVEVSEETKVQEEQTVD